MSKSFHSAAYEEFRQILISGRKAKGLTQVQVAKKLHRPQSFVSKYEHGERRLDVVEFLQIAKVLGIDASEVVRNLDE